MKINAERTDKAIVILTIRDTAQMTPTTKRMIAKWLCQQARDLIELGWSYNKKITMRYLMSQSEKAERR